MPRLTELTEAEERLIQAYVFLPLVRRVLEHDKKAIEAGAIKFKDPYIELIDMMLNRVSMDLRDIKSEFGRQKIKMITHGDLEYEAVVRGWTHKVIYHPSVAREWVEKYMREYMSRPIIFSKKSPV